MCLQLVSHQVEAIVKAMLNSPNADHAGFSTLFGAAEFRQLSSRCPKLIGRIKLCNNYIKAVDEWLQAYTELAAEVLLRLISKMEVDAIMWAFSKKVVTRTNHDSIEKVMVAVMDEAKTLYPSMPEMPMFKALAQDEKVKRISSRANLLAKTPKDGCIANEVLIAKGIVPGAELEEKFGDKRTLKIVALSGDEQTILCQIGEDASTLHYSVARADLHNYTLIKMQSIVSLGKMVSPLYVMHKVLVESAVKLYLAALFANGAYNAEEHCDVLWSTSVFMKLKKKLTAGRLKLYPITSSVPIVPGSHTISGYMPIGQTRLGKAKPVDATIFIKSANSNGKREDFVKDHDDNFFISKFWLAIKSCSTTDPRVANCEIQYVDHEIKIGCEKLPIKVPIIVNTKTMDEGTVITVLVESKSEGPALKKPRMQASPMNARCPRPLA